MQQLISDFLVKPSKLGDPMNCNLETVIAKSAPLRHTVVKHPLFARIRELEHVRLFMQHHVYAVWDFMSLVKTLQRELTCVSVPWFPKGNADTRFLINEIVVGEESDIDMNGKRISHFELYLEAMRHCDADTRGIEQFLAALGQTGDLEESFEAAGTPSEARAFVNFTFNIIRDAKPHVVAAVFCFGREELIPDMFLALISELQLRAPANLAPLRYYLNRHVEIDGGHHRALALQMVSNLCGSDEARWQEASEAVEECLTRRAELWDSVLHALVARKN